MNALPFQVNCVNWLNTLHKGKVTLEGNMQLCSFQAGNYLKLIATLWEFWSHQTIFTIAIQFQDIFLALLSHLLVQSCLLMFGKHIWFIIQSNECFVNSKGNFWTGKICSSVAEITLWNPRVLMGKKKHCPSLCPLGLTFFTCIMRSVITIGGVNLVKKIKG